MSVDIHIDAAAGLITYKVAGDLGLADIRAAVERAHAGEGFRPGMNALWHIKEGHIAVTATELPDLIAFLETMTRTRGEDYRVAIVVRYNIDFGLSTVFQMHAYSLPFEVKIFQSLTQAQHWVQGGDA